jgi:hypothetical protein
MKTRFIVVIIAALMGVSTLTASADSNKSMNGTPGGPVTIVKGYIYDWGNDGTWDLLTFGFIGPRFAHVTYIELTDLNGKFIGRIDQLSYLGGMGITWFGVQLGKHGIKGDFLMKIHVSTRKGGIVAPIYLRSAANGSGVPEDPEETIIVIKWP